MLIASRPSDRSRLVVAAGIVIALAIIVVAAALLSPGRTLAQAGGADRAEPRPVGASSSAPPSLASQASPPTATPEPGAIQAGSGSRTGGGDLEVVRFRPQISLRRGESPPATAAQKPAGQAGADPLRRPAGEAWGPPEPYQAPDVDAILSPLDWTPLLYENFVDFSPPALGTPFSPRYGVSVWTVYDLSDFDFGERSWGANNWTYYPHDDDPSDDQSAWPAAAGPDALDPNEWYYVNNMYSWLDYGPVDMSDMSDVFVSFGLWYETEPVYDRIYFCASVDGFTYNCDYWSGYSGGWTDQAYWLTSFAGYSEVWIAWVFESNENTVDDGPFVDEIYIYGYDVSATPTPTPTPDPEGELIENGSFETGDLTHWDSESSGGAGALEREVERRPLLPGSDRELDVSAVGSVEGALETTAVGVTDAAAVHGRYSAYLWRSGGEGNDFLYQTVDVPSGVTDVVLDFWFGVTTYEMAMRTDWFCVSMSDPNNHPDIWVDLGCVDAAFTTGHWQHVGYTLDPSEVAAVAGRSVDLVFELYNRGTAGTGTTGWVDYVRVYATGEGGGSYVDPHEPNDDPDSATGITCGETISGTIGDAMGDYGDVDWFELRNVPSGQLDVDITADTQVPPSALDSVVGLWDSNLVFPVAWNDDDGVSYDSYVTYTNPVSGATFYVSVESYSGYGGPDSFYDLEVLCAGSGSGPPPGGSEPVAPPDDTWTIMLYLNAEDRYFEPIVRKYIADMETVLGGKTDFMTVTVLYDGSSDGDTTRYLLQPDGAYTNGTDRWPMGEKNMGDPDTLAAFANWAMDQYPAENYYLAIDDHGHGVYGISWDATNDDDALTPPELYSALKDITNNGARKIDIFDYEACLMGMAENAYDVREWVDYVVFSEQISWGINTYPRYFSDLASGDEPLAVGRRIVGRYHAEADDEGYPHTISLVHTGVMTAVKQAATDFADVLSASLTITQVNGIRGDSQAFAADNDATNPDLADYIDLYDLAQEVKAAGFASTQAADLQSAVQGAVQAEEHSSGEVDGFTWDHSGVHGLSVYYPASNASSVFRDYTAPRLFRMSTDEGGIDGRWDEFLLWAVTTGGNGAGDGLGGGDRKGMNAGRFLQPKLGGSSFLYVPLVLRR